MASYSKRILSGSTNGAAILVTQTATLGDTIHTAVSGTSDIDEIYLYAYNTSANTSIKLTIEFGGVATKDLIEVSIPGEGGARLVVPGYLLQNSLVVTAFAGTANVVAVTGFVNRITA